MKKIKCLVCDKKLGSITHIHLKTHNMSVKEYRELYPNAELMGDSVKSGLFKKGMTLSEEHKETLSRVHGGSKLSEEHRAKISKSSKGKKFSEETKRLWSKQRTGRKHTEETRRKISESNIGKRHTKEAKKRIGESSKGRLVGDKHPNWGKPSRHTCKSTIYVRKDGREIWVRSSWELEVAAYLDKLGVEWEYEMTQYSLGDTNYSPDFFIFEDGNLCKVVEVKGWMKDEDLYKINKFRELYPDTCLEVWDKKVLLSKGLKIK